MNYSIIKNHGLFTQWKFRFMLAKAEFCTLYLFIGGHIRPWRQGYASLSLIGWMAAMGCRWEAVKIRWSAVGSKRDCLLGSSMLLHICRCPPPLLSRSLLLISVSGFAAADSSLLETRQELMVMSQLPWLKTPSHAHNFLCRNQSPFVRPQVTRDPSPADPWG